MAKLWPQPPHIHLKECLLGFVFWFLFYGAGKICLTFYYQSEFEDIISMFSVYEEQGKYFCHAPWAEAWSKSAEGRKREILNSGNNQSKSAKERKREKLNSGNNQDFSMIFAGKLNLRKRLPKKSEKWKGNA